MTDLETLAFARSVLNENHCDGPERDLRDTRAALEYVISVLEAMLKREASLEAVAGECLQSLRRGGGTTC